MPVNLTHSPGPFRYEHRVRDGWGQTGLWAADGTLIVGDDVGWDAPAVLPAVGSPDANLLQASDKLLAACEAVLLWAKTPGNHGGNPYQHAFMRLVQEAVAEAKGEKPC